jgi:hypothetical protein
MILTGEDGSTGRNACHIATLSTTNLTLTDLGSNPGLRCKTPRTGRLSNGTALKTKIIPIIDNDSTRTAQ